MAERPSLGRDDSYNRVTVSRDLKSQIMNMIADSSESLPLHTVDESDEDDSAPKNKGNVGKLAAPTTTNGAGGGSKLAAEPINAGDFATPTPEKPNPLEQVATVRADSHNKNGGSAASDLATASPMRSHDPEGPELGKLGKRISRMVTHSDTNLAGTDGETKARDDEGETASRTTTATQGSTNVGGRTRPGMDKRQSTMKRISSAFKRSVSKNQ
jgi:hypothetical protein